MQAPLNQRTHVVHHLATSAGSLTNCVKRLAVSIKKGAPGGMAYFQFIGGGDEFRAVPETGCGLYRHAIDGCGDQESDPTHEVVYGFVLFHSDYS